jgi:REP element-mobilizing transposase RayT
MPKKSLIRSNVHPYHVTARCNNREEYYCDLETVWLIFSFYLNEIVQLHGVKVHAFVLMPNHFHLLISTPKDDLGVVMKRFISSVTRAINTKTKRTGRVFGARYYWSIVTTDGYFDFALKYVYRNPVKANMVNLVEDYRFSTLNSLLGTRPLFFPIHPPLGSASLIPNNQLVEFLAWLNQPFRKEVDHEIRNRLSKRGIH